MALLNQITVDCKQCGKKHTLSYGSQATNSIDDILGSVTSCPCGMTITCNQTGVITQSSKQGQIWKVILEDELKEAIVKVKHPGFQIIGDDTIYPIQKVKKWLEIIDIKDTTETGFYIARITTVDSTFKTFGMYKKDDKFVTIHDGKIKTYKENFELTKKISNEDLLDAFNETEILDLFNDYDNDDWGDDDAEDEVTITTQVEADDILRRIPTDGPIKPFNPNPLVDDDDDVFRMNTILD